MPRTPKIFVARALYTDAEVWLLIRKNSFAANTNGPFSRPQCAIRICGAALRPRLQVQGGRMSCDDDTRVT
ncbi:hypothetical protein JXA88_02585 [Candidatus Fermentibacteria bacterium]|nr:hypothetical protein [Candidatus Fermentibacteria bacterium]